MEADALQAEVDRLRGEVESYRQREVAELRSALAIAHQDIAALRAECNRISHEAISIGNQFQDQIAELRAQLEVKEQVARTLSRANAGRN